MSGEGGMGAIQQSMLQTKISQDGKGGVASVIDDHLPVKLGGVNFAQAQTGNVDQIGQQFTAAAGLMAGNVSDMVGFVKDANAFGMPSIIGEVQDINQKLSGTMHPRINIHGEAAVSIIEMQNDMHAHSAREGNGLLSAGVSAFQGQSPALSVSPGYTPMRSQSHGQGI